MIVETAPPGGGPPPHIHSREDETLIVLDGQLEILADDVWTPLPIGEIAFLKRGALHTFRNSGTQPGRIPASFFPSGFEQFFPKFARGLTPENLAEHLKDAGDHVGFSFLLEDGPNILTKHG